MQAKEFTQNTHSVFHSSIEWCIMLQISKAFLRKKLQNYLYRDMKFRDQIAVSTIQTTGHIIKSGINIL